MLLRQFPSIINDQMRSLLFSRVVIQHRPVPQLFLFQTLRWKNVLRQAYKRPRGGNRPKVKHIGLKALSNEYVTPQHMLAKQRRYVAFNPNVSRKRNFKFYPGENVQVDRSTSLYSTTWGRVKFTYDVTRHVFIINVLPEVREELTAQDLWRYKLERVRSMEENRNICWLRTKAGTIFPKPLVNPPTKPLPQSKKKNSVDIWENYALMDNKLRNLARQTPGSRQNLKNSHGLLEMQHYLTGPPNTFAAAPFYFSQPLFSSSQPSVQYTYGHIPGSFSQATQPVQQNSPAAVTLPANPPSGKPVSLAEIRSKLKELSASGDKSIQDKQKPPFYQKNIKLKPHMRVLPLRESNGIQFYPIIDPLNKGARYVMCGHCASQRLFQKLDNIRRHLRQCDGYLELCKKNNVAVLSQMSKIDELQLDNTLVDKDTESLVVQTTATRQPVIFSQTLPSQLGPNRIMTQDTPAPFLNQFWNINSDKLSNKNAKKNLFHSPMVGQNGSSVTNTSIADADSFLRAETPNLNVSSTLDYPQFNNCEDFNCAQQYSNKWISRKVSTKQNNENIENVACFSSSTWNDSPIVQKQFSHNQPDFNEKNQQFLFNQNELPNPLKDENSQLNEKCSNTAILHFPNPSIENGSNRNALETSNVCKDNSKISGKDCSNGCTDSVVQKKKQICESKTVPLIYPSKGVKDNSRSELHYCSLTQASTDHTIHDLDYWLLSQFQANSNDTDTTDNFKQFDLVNHNIHDFSETKTVGCVELENLTKLIACGNHSSQQLIVSSQTVPIDDKSSDKTGVNVNTKNFSSLSLPARIISDEQTTCEKNKEQIMSSFSSIAFGKNYEPKKNQKVVKQVQKFKQITKVHKRSILTQTDNSFLLDSKDDSVPILTKFTTRTKMCNNDKSIIKRSKSIPKLATKPCSSLNRMDSLTYSQHNARIKPIKPISTRLIKTDCHFNYVNMVSNKNKIWDSALTFFQRSESSRQHPCSICKIVNKLGNDDLVVCDACKKLFHLQCVTFPHNQKPNNDWICVECINYGFVLNGIYQPGELVWFCHSGEIWPSIILYGDYNEDAEEILYLVAYIGYEEVELCSSSSCKSWEIGYGMWRKLSESTRHSNQKKMDAIHQAISIKMNGIDALTVFGTSMMPLRNRYQLFQKLLNDETEDTCDKNQLEVNFEAKKNRSGHIRLCEAERVGTTKVPIKEAKKLSGQQIKNSSFKQICANHNNDTITSGSKLNTRQIISLEKQNTLSVLNNYNDNLLTDLFSDNMFLNTHKTSIPESRRKRRIRHQVNMKSYITTQQNVSLTKQQTINNGVTEHDNEVCIKYEKSRPKFQLFNVDPTNKPKKPIRQTKTTHLIKTQARQHDVTTFILQNNKNKLPRKRLLRESNEAELLVRRSLRLKKKNTDFIVPEVLKCSSVFSRNSRMHSKTQKEFINNIKNSPNAIIGTRISIKENTDKRWHTGTIVYYDEELGCHMVVYDEDKTVFYNLHKCDVKILSKAL